jgi:hypothetical protein
MRVALALVLAACGGDFGPDVQPGLCSTAILVTPGEPVAGSDTRIRLEARVRDAGGVFEYQWRVFHGGTELPTEPGSLDGSVVLVPAPDPVVYDVFLRVLADDFCPEAQASIAIAAPGAGEGELRLRVVAPAADRRPPVETRVIVRGAAEDLLAPTLVTRATTTTVQLVDDRGVAAAGYLAFHPETARDVAIELYAGADGRLAPALRVEPHDVVVIPDSPALAPRRLRWTTAETQLVVDGGTAINGAVRDAANAPVAGVRVQLAVDGLVSTIGTTDAAGAFTLRARPTLGAAVRVDVMPPPGSALPRLVATTTALALDRSLAIRFAAVTPRDLAGAIVRRGGDPVGGARITVVGTVAGAGTITAGATAIAAGEVRASVRANGAGVLPALALPAAELAAVIEAAPGDFAVTALDLTAGVPVAIAAPPTIAVATAITDPADTPLAGVTVEAIPSGALALANAPSIRVVSQAAGAITARLASGGSYELRFTDAAGRGGQLVVGDVTAGSLAARHALHPGTRVLGAVIDVGDVGLPNVAVQLRCASCTGLARERPIAEGVTGLDGRFSLVVPTP